MRRNRIHEDSRRVSHAIKHTKRLTLKAKKLIESVLNKTEIKDELLTNILTKTEI